MTLRQTIPAKKIVFLLVLWLSMGIIISACQPSEEAPADVPPSPAPTATRTPFMPLPPTAIYTPSPMAPPPATATPTVTPVTPQVNLPHAVPPIPQANTRINILLLGSDQRSGHTDFRTDAFIVLSYNPETGATSLISIPRDTYVYLPGLFYQRINTALEFGGFPLVQRTLEYNFGFRPSYYLLVSFPSFTALVDSLGGVDVFVPHQLCDKSPYAKGIYCIGPGTVHMDGKLALWYARSRETTNDFDRAARQQALLKALFAKALSLNSLSRAPEIYQAYRSMVVTNIGLTDFLKIVAQASRFEMDKVKTYVITPPALQPWITPEGAYVLLPNHQAVRSILEEAFSR